MKSLKPYASLVLTIYMLCLFLTVNAQEPELIANAGHIAPIQHVEYSPDGKFYLSLGSDHLIKLWDTKTGKLIHNYGSEYLGPYYDANFTPNGEQILLVEKKSAKLLDIKTKTITRLFKTKKELKDVHFTPDGKFLISIKSDSITIRNAETGNLLRTIESKKLDYINNFYITPNGKYLFLNGRQSFSLFRKRDKYIELWDLENWKYLNAYKTEHKNYVGFHLRHITFQPSGKRFISMNGQWGKIVLWKKNKKRPYKVINYPSNNTLKCVALCPNKDIFATGDVGGSIQLWDASTGKKIKTLYKTSTSGPKMIRISFSPDGKNLLASINNDIRIFEIASGKIVRTHKEESPDLIQTMKISKDGHNIFSIANNKLRKWNLNNNKQFTSYVKTEKGDIKDLDISQNEKYVLTTCRNKEHISLNLRDYSNGNKIETFKYLKRKGAISSSINKDTIYSLLYINPTKRSLFKWHINKSEEPISVYTAKSFSWPVAFDFKGKFAACEDYASGNYILRIWDLYNNSIDSYTVNTNHTEFNLCFSPDNKFIATAQFNGEIKLFSLNRKKFIHSKKIFDLKQWRKRRKWKENISVIYSPDGQYILVARRNRIKLVDANSLEEIKSFNNKTIVNNLAFYPGENRFISAGFDGSLKIWNHNTGKLLLTFYGLNDSKDWVALTPDGKFYGTETGMKNLHYVKGTQVIPLESFFEKGYTPNLVQSVLQNKDISGEGINLADLKNPPSVTISSPENYAKSDSRESKVIVKATDQGGGIDEIRLYHNGKLVQNTQRGFKKVEKANEEITKTFTVQLVKGQNEIKATAFNNQRTESIPDRVSVMYEGPRSESELYLITVGINKYKNPKYNLNYAYSDAKSFKEKVKQGGKSIFRDIQTYFISDNQATKDNIEAIFNKIQQKAGPEDVFIFYYAGHGVMSQEKDPQFYLAPYEVTQLYGNNALLQSKGLSAEYLQNKSREIAARKQLFIMDACQSGGMVDHLAMRGAAEEKAVAQLARSTGTYWLTASGSEQFATEFKTLGHGLFTHSILMGLQGDADGGAKDGKITVKEISSFLNDMVPELSTKHKGEPQYPNTYGYGQDFPVVIVK